MTVTQAADREAMKQVVRRNAEDVQSKGDWAAFDEMFADDFEDFTPTPGMGNNKVAILGLYKAFRVSFPDLRTEVHWQRVENNVVTSFKTYHGTHEGDLMGIPATGKRVRFSPVDAMRVVNGRIDAHWGVADLLSVLIQIGALLPPKAA